MQGAIVKHKNFSAVQEHCPTKLLAIHYSLFAVRYLPFTIRHSLSFRLGRRLVFPIFPVPRPTTLVPLKVGAQFLRYQLWTKACSMFCF